MKRTLATGTALLLAFGLVACGGGEAGGGAAEEEGARTARAEGGGEAAAELSVPDWMTVDEQAQTVTMDIVAGQSATNNSWNFNGYHSGNATIVVPEGWEITIHFENADQVNPHSVGIDSKVGGYPSVFNEVTPAFEGAVTSGALEMAAATQPGQSESITFTASKAGEYAAVCYVPAHATSGMWIRFNVSAEGDVGFRASS